jgi:hypothetical protein
MNAAIKPGQHGSLWWNQWQRGYCGALEVVKKSSVNVQEILRAGLNEIVEKSTPFQ